MRLKDSLSSNFYTIFIHKGYAIVNQLRGLERKPYIRCKSHYNLSFGNKKKGDIPFL